MLLSGRINVSPPCGVGTKNRLLGRLPSWEPGSILRKASVAHSGFSVKILMVSSNSTMIVGFKEVIRFILTPNSIR